MKYYLQINQEGFITDAIDYPLDGYVLYETDYPLPLGINGGWWKLEDGNPVEYVTLKPKNVDIEELRLKQNQVELAIAELSMLIGGN